MRVTTLPWMCACAWLLAAAAHAQQSDEELAKQLSNPVASLISVPFQQNVDCCFGPENGARYTLNIQPVIPVSMNENWNTIVRTIIPLIYAEEPLENLGDDSGFGDITQSFFISPKHSSGLIWGLGPVFLWPIGKSTLGSEKWGAGPTALVLKQAGHTTIGFLANHLWSYAGDEDRADVSSTFLQPFYNYNTSDGTTYIVTSESTYNWTEGEWTVPLNVGMSHLFNFGGQRVSLGAQGRAYLIRDDEPDWGLRAFATFLFPK